MNTHVNNHSLMGTKCCLGFCVLDAASWKFDYQTNKNKLRTFTGVNFLKELALTYQACIV